MKKEPKNFILEKEEQNVVKEFFEGWALYEKVIENNYMDHHEIIELLIAGLNLLETKTLSVLELGSGDSHNISKVAERVNITDYCGIDLSTMALAMAEKKLQKIIKQVTLKNGDMLSELEKIDQSYDLIIAGYSIHHLDLAGKERVLSHAHRLLKPQGKVIIYDIVNAENESKDVFLNRCVDYFDQYWTAMTAQQLIMIREHVLIQDFPEPLSVWKQLAEKKGYREHRCNYWDKNKMYAVMEFLT